jgi:hypothetical protein
MNRGCPLSKDVETNWDGHAPATSEVLLDVITTATTGSAKVSRADRILFTACEFWAAARNRTCISQLSDDAADQLQAAETAFKVIGLVKSANILRTSRIALTELEPRRSVQEVAEYLETALAEVDEPVDEMIAEYAKKQPWSR